MVKGKFYTRLKQNWKEIYTRLKRNWKTEQQIIYFFYGIDVVVVLNSLATPSPISFIIIAVGITCLVGIMALKKDIDVHIRLRLIFLGASVASIISAFISFFSIVQGQTMTITPTTFTSIFRSILLASFFSFLERLTKFLEDKTSKREIVRAHSTLIQTPQSRRPYQINE